MIKQGGVFYIYVVKNNYLNKINSATFKKITFLKMNKDNAVAPKKTSFLGFLNIKIQTSKEGFCY